MISATAASLPSRPNGIWQILANISKHILISWQHQEGYIGHSESKSLSVLLFSVLHLLFSFWTWWAERIWFFSPSMKRWLKWDKTALLVGEFLLIWVRRLCWYICPVSHRHCFWRPFCAASVKPGIESWWIGRKALIKGGCESHLSAENNGSHRDEWSSWPVAPQNNRTADFQCPVETLHLLLAQKL